ncbi:MAG: tetratricopeptide repeat protein [SAR202 cluster bacterium]|nr:tetratricopeptide repeat protein [SAR202 cluster bacterium]
MNLSGFAEKEMVRKEKAKTAVALAMNSRWEEAVNFNRAMLRAFPKDLEAFNRLGKALTELGHNKEAKEAFNSALDISPNNAITKKNLARLERLADEETPRTAARASKGSHAFIEESGKTGVTSLSHLGPAEVRVKLTAGDSVQLEVSGSGLKVSDASSERIGRVEPKMASRLVKLMKGGNKYEAFVTSAEERELAIIIRETFMHPSQSGVVSFPARGNGGLRVYLPGTVLGREGAVDAPDGDAVAVKDWSDDDTEPGDDEAFTPVLHRIINPSEANFDDEF